MGKKYNNIELAKTHLCAAELLFKEKELQLANQYVAGKFLISSLTLAMRYLIDDNSALSLYELFNRAESGAMDQEWFTKLYPYAKELWEYNESIEMSQQQFAALGALVEKAVAFASCNTGEADDSFDLCIEHHLENLGERIGIGEIKHLLPKDFIKLSAEEQFKAVKYACSLV